MRTLCFALLLLLGSGWTSPAFAWGESGHRLVCEIAWQHLTPVARSRVGHLLQANSAILADAAHNAQFGWACTYPDHPAPNGQRRREPEHYVTYPRELAAVTGPGCAEAPSCVLSAIDADAAILRSPTASESDKAAALVFLGHWIGDIHMPLHASFRDDKEGSAIDTQGLCVTSLHWTWDNCILEARMPPGRSDDDIAALARAWSGAITARERSRWFAAQPWQWAAESFALAHIPALQYCAMAGRTCRYSPTQGMWDAGQPHRIVQVDAAYMDFAMPIIQRRIVQGGLRLANWLNRTLDPAHGRRLHA